MKTTDELLDDLAAELVLIERQNINTAFDIGYTKGTRSMTKAQQLVGQIRYNLQTHDKH